MRIEKRLNQSARADDRVKPLTNAAGGVRGEQQNNYQSLREQTTEDEGLIVPEYLSLANAGLESRGGQAPTG
ncbi:MAG TPA: hypothetical protein VGC66_05635 [Pyrinomonadaceae bacterium]